MRDSILDWGKTLLTNNPPSTLKQLADQLQDQDLKAAFEQLDRQLYKGDNCADDLDLKRLIKQLRTKSSRIATEAKKQPKGQVLNSLYPGKQ